MVADGRSVEGETYLRIRQAIKYINGEKRAKIPRRNERMAYPSSSSFDLIDNALNVIQPKLSRMMNDLSREFYTSALPSVVNGLKEMNSVGGGMDVDIVRKKDSYEIIADLPGFTRTDVQLDVSKDKVVSISAMRKADPSATDGDYIVTGRGYGKFSYEVQMPDDCDLDAVSAKMEHGVLRVTIKRTKPEKRNKVSIAIE